MWGKQQQPESNGLQCSLVKVPSVFIEPIPRQKITYLMEEYTHQEWLAYLVGRISKKENIFVEDIVIPPHKEANGASAEAEPLHIPTNCVGVIHSHHSMGAFHSGTDQAYVDKNYPVSITVARNGTNNLSFDAVSYGRTPCGKYLLTKPVIKYVQPPSLFDRESFLKKAKENIDKGKRVYTVASVASKEGSYIPLRYRDKMTEEAFGSKELFTDGQGNIFSKKELDSIMGKIYGESEEAGRKEG